jgi:hypothetical protein
LGERAHEALIKKHHSNHLLKHISRNATAIKAWEKVCAEAKQKAKEKAEMKSKKTTQNGLNNRLPTDMHKSNIRIRQFMRAKEGNFI